MTTRAVNISSLLKRNNTWLRDSTKRIFDIAGAAIALIILAPVMGLIALAIRRDSPGSVIYHGMRVGRGGKYFNILKFRTMYETPDSYRGPRVTAHDDPRITPVGRWLRDTKLNELPQFWNVLKGEMSLVGPRPEDPSIAKTWPRSTWEEVLSVRPGITSPASVMYRNEETMLCAGNVLQQYIKELRPDKMRLDQLYVRYRTFLLDLDVLLWTALIMLPRLRSHSIPEQFLFVGPFTVLIRRYLNWFTIDLVITFTVISLTGLVWRWFEPLNVGWPNAVVLAVGFSLLFSVTGAIFGVNRISWSKAVVQDMFDLFPSWLSATAIALLINQLMSFFPTGLVLIASILALCGFIIVRYRSRIITGILCRLMYKRTEAMTARERVIIVGSGLNSQHIAWLLHHPMYANKFQIIGIADNDLFDQGMRIYGEKVIGKYVDIPNLVKIHDIGLVIVADQNILAENYQAIKEAFQSPGARIVILPDISTILSDLVKPQAMESIVMGIGEGESPIGQCFVGFGAMSSDDLEQRVEKLRNEKG